ncbi:MAG: sulfite exporter TauE/SafE family protein [Chloroflexi bacterium]|nr:sulfite exporter TauE/SafE family protein [Chloroflexota bacterium]MBU1749434.1 sulfite exporter TauE/SafE family protein [Chloroflexota bacterium]
MTPEQILLTILIIFIGHMIKGFTGFGSALVASPLMAWFMPLRAIVPLMALIGVPSGAYMMAVTRRHIDWRETLLVSAAMIVTTWIGMQVLLTVENQILKQAFAVVTVLFTLPILWNRMPTRQRRSHPLATLLVGAAAGLAGILFAVPGPPLVLYFSYTMTDDVDRFRGTLSAIFLSSGLIQTVAFAGEGMLTPDLLGLAVALTPVVFVGLWAGDWLVRRAPAQRFRWVVAAVLIANAVLLWF